MMISESKHLLMISGIIAACFVLCTSHLQGEEKRYEVRPEITVPEYKTDITRMVEAYERLINSSLRTTEKQLTDLQGDVDAVMSKLSGIDQKLSLLSVQMQAIELKLGIESAAEPIRNNTRSEEDKSRTLKTTP